MGSLIARIRRSGGPFDPEGCRPADVARGDDIKAVAASLPGRWLMITLTVDRRLFLGPAAAYQRCNEYVRKAVAPACPSGIWFATFEVQGKTGDGWPHWHVFAWCPDGRTPGMIKRAVERAWRTRTESVDPETGEVTRSVDRIGFVDVEEARSVVGAGVYVSKYLTKAWPAVPPWMGHSRTRFRKVRISSQAYEVMEKLHRHTRTRGSRRPHRPVNGARRTLFSRMARSGSALHIFRVEQYGRLAFAGQLPVPRDDVLGLVDAGLMGVVRLGHWRRMIFSVQPGLVNHVRHHASFWRLRSQEYERARRAELAWSWHRCQEERRRADCEHEGQGVSSGEDRRPDVVQLVREDRDALPGSAGEG